jgi:hypothetical protein
MSEQYTLANAVLPPSTITFSVNRPESNTKVMEITKDGIWVNPDVSVDDTAKAVLDALDVYIKKLMKEVVHQEREACAKLLENGRFLHDEAPAKILAKEAAKAIRKRGEK